MELMLQIHSEFAPRFSKILRKIQESLLQIQKRKTYRRTEDEQVIQKAAAPLPEHGQASEKSEIVPIVLLGQRNTTVTATEVVTSRSSRSACFLALNLSSQGETGRRREVVVV